MGIKWIWWYEDFFRGQYWKNGKAGRFFKVKKSVWRKKMVLKIGQNPKFSIFIHNSIFEA